MLVDLEIVLDAENITWAHGVLLGLTCLSLLAVTLNRWMRWKNSRRKVEKINMIKVDIPFSVSLEDDKNYAIVKSCVPNKVEIYWDFYNGELCQALKKQWVAEEYTMKTHLCATYYSEISDSGETCFILNEEDVVAHSVPRETYLVAVFVRNLKKPLKPRDILGLITVIDLGDTLNRTGIHPRIVGRYLKFNCGSIISLQRFFPSGLNQDGANIDLCVVCRDNPVTRVVLPCRHACYCSPCFERVSTCSMCTANIHSYFCIDPYIDDID